jgi:hypothetical protein
VVGRKKKEEERDASWPETRLQKSTDVTVGRQGAELCNNSSGPLSSPFSLQSTQLRTNGDASQFSFFLSCFFVLVRANSAQLARLSLCLGKLSSSIPGIPSPSPFSSKSFHLPAVLIIISAGIRSAPHVNNKTSEFVLSPSSSSPPHVHVCYYWQLSSAQVITKASIPQL